MHLKYPDLWLWVSFIILLLMGIGASICYVIYPSFNLVNILSGYATFAIALLTVVYVATTRHQLRIMGLQLGEMTRARELQAQPLPWPISFRVFTEPPRLFLGVLEAPIAVCRHFVEVRIRNLGTSPAVSVDINCRLQVPAKEGIIEWDAVSVRAEAIEEKSEFPYEEGRYSGFLYPEDNDGRLINALLENRIERLPYLQVNILYRNILGGCFQLRRVYRLYPRKDCRDILISWLERIRNFSLRNKEDLIFFTQNKKSLDPMVEKLWETLTQKCEEGLSREEVFHEIVSLPEASEVSPLSTDKYRQAVGSLSYGLRIDSSHVCPASE